MVTLMEQFGSQIGYINMKKILQINKIVLISVALVLAVIFSESLISNAQTPSVKRTISVIHNENSDCAKINEKGALGDSFQIRGKQGNKLFDGRIDKFGSCRVVINGLDDKLFIPLRSPEEWCSFIKNAPEKVSILNCTRPETIDSIGDISGTTIAHRVLKHPGTLKNICICNNCRERRNRYVSKCQLYAKNKSVVVGDEYRKGNVTDCFLSGTGAWKELAYNYCEGGGSHCWRSKSIHSD